MWSLAWPWALAALPLPFIARALLPESPSLQDAGLKVPSLTAFASLTQRPNSEQLLNWRFWVAAIAWLLLVVAAARPERIGDEIDVPVSGRNLMLAVDLSGSMGREDFLANGRPATRLDVVKAAADDFIARRTGDRVGLVLFSDRAYVQAPLTEDLDTILALLDSTEVGMAGPQTALGDSIGLAIRSFESSEVDDRLLILLTDGNDTASTENATTYLIP